MKHLIPILAFAVQTLGAEELVIGDPSWGSRIKLPDQWESDNYTGMWYQGWTKDRKVWLSAITFAQLPADWHSKWLPKHCETFGVEVTVPADKPIAVECRLGGLDAKEYRIAANWDDAPAEVSVFEVTLATNRVFLFTVGGKASDRLLHKETIAGIVGSILVKPISAPQPPPK
jgi:hypothetical protein